VRGHHRRTDLAPLAPTGGVEREWKKLRASHDRDSRYVGKVVGMLREAVKTDDFPTRLEWHLFQMRLARFDIAREDRLVWPPAPAEAAPPPGLQPRPGAGGGAEERHPAGKVGPSPVKRVAEHPSPDHLAQQHRRHGR
jgi:hypothetical protein